MELKELQEIVGRWYNTGHISDENRARIKAEYFRVTKTSDTGRCSRCPDFWNDVQTTLRIHLKKNEMPVMAKVRKYLLANNDTFVPRGSNIHYVNEGTETEYRKVLTDKAAEYFIKRNPALLGTTIIENPDYVAPEMAHKTPTKPTIQRSAKVTPTPTTSAENGPETGKGSESGSQTKNPVE
ncbi:hypothetical protein [Larkinella arboricola]